MGAKADHIIIKEKTLYLPKDNSQVLIGFKALSVFYRWLKRCFFFAFWFHVKN